MRKTTSAVKFKVCLQDQTDKGRQIQYCRPAETHLKSVITASKHLLYENKRKKNKHKSVHIHTFVVYNQLNYTTGQKASHSCFNEYYFGISVTS